ncbi:MAG: sulfatase [Planctomycetaceae bacterium]|nr:sulfatase [Planctomycetaceae bacterium]
MKISHCALRLLIGLVLFCKVAGTLAVAADTRPNIVFAFADDWGRYASAYAALDPGGPSDLVSTPNFDRVARDGVLFTKAFVNAPSCTPCRSSLLSGQYFWRTGRGAILSGAVWDETIPTYPLLLQSHGYHIGHTYKVWSPGTPVNAPYGGGATAYVKRGGAMNQFSQKLMNSADPEAEKQTILAQVRGNFQDFLADRKDDQPFCYWFGPTNCHRKWAAGSGKKLWGIDPDKLAGKMPGYLPDVSLVREDLADYLGEAQAFDAALGVLLDELQQRGELENTMVVVSGDHGFPGFPHGKCNLYDPGVHVGLAISWPTKVPSNRVVDDFVCLPDLAPTFLEIAGVEVPEVMTGKSLVPVLRSEKSGLVDPSRDAVIVGRERHVGSAREDNLPYPQRAIITRDYLYIHNFKADRWPMGDAPGFGQPAGPFAAFEDLRENTFAAFGDLDASPTKAWLITHRDDPGMRPLFERAFGQRPQTELFDLRTDPHCLTNIANQTEARDVQAQLHTRLMQVLETTGDPRVQGDGTTFDKPPYSSPAQPGGKRPAKRQGQGK